MKILHTADWHIGNVFFGNDRSEEHRAFFDFLLATIDDTRPDALIVAGDVFDTSNPSAEAQTLYYGFLNTAVQHNPGMQIVIIAGNHDSAGRLEAPAPILAAANIHVRGVLRRNADGKPDFNNLMIPLHAVRHSDDRAVCLAVPFLRSYELPQAKSFAESMTKFFSALDDAVRRRYGKYIPVVLAAHFYATGSEITDDDHSERIIVGGEESVSTAPLRDKFSYIALGHIHKAQSVGGMEHVRYAGSALPMSFAEKHYRHGVELVEITDSGDLEITSIPFTPPRTLISIPEKGAATLERALEEIDKLPEKGRHDMRNTYPYIEVKIAATETDTDTPRKIREHFEGKAAVLCSIKRIDNSIPDYKELEIRTSEELRRLSPLSVAQTIYRKRFGGEEMPPALTQTLQEAEQSATLSEENEQ